MSTRGRGRKVGVTIHSPITLVRVPTTFCSSVYPFYYLPRFPLPQCSSILCLCVICGANGKYNYPTSRLSLGLPVVLIIMCCSVYSTSNRTALFCPHRTKARIIHTYDNAIAIRGVGIVGRLSTRPETQNCNTTPSVHFTLNSC